MEWTVCDALPGQQSCWCPCYSSPAEHLGTSLHLLLPSQTALSAQHPPEHRKAAWLLPPGSCKVLWPPSDHQVPHNAVQLAVQYPESGSCTTPAVHRLWPRRESYMWELMLFWAIATQTLTLLYLHSMVMQHFSVLVLEYHCPACLDVSLQQHTWFKWTDHLTAAQNPQKHAEHWHWGQALKNNLVRDAVSGTVKKGFHLHVNIDSDIHTSPAMRHWEDVNNRFQRRFQITSIAPGDK